MNIILIYPFFSIDRLHIENIEAPPIGLHYLGALLKEQGHEVELLNWHDIKHKPHIIQDALLALKPDLVGFSIFHGKPLGGESNWQKYSRSISQVFRLFLAELAQLFWTIICCDTFPGSTS